MSSYIAFDIHKDRFLAKFAQIRASHKAPVAIGYIHKHLLVLVIQRDVKRGAFARLEVYQFLELTRIGFGNCCGIVSIGIFYSEPSINMKGSGISFELFS